MVTNEKRKIIRYEACLVDASGIVGREGDKKVLLQKLLGGEDESCNRNFSVVFIVGVGGVGKTTLLLYGEVGGKDHFKLRDLDCVSDEIKIFNVSKVMDQLVTEENKEFVDLNLLEEMLKEKLVKKCFIMVLDDVWNESYLSLALRTLGRLLRTKTYEKEWKEREMRLFRFLD